MAKIKLIDTKDEFLLEIDGVETSHANDYEIAKSALEYLTKKLDIETDKTVKT